MELFRVKDRVIELERNVSGCFSRGYLERERDYFINVLFIERYYCKGYGMLEFVEIYVDLVDCFLGCFSKFFEFFFI